MGRNAEGRQFVKSGAFGASGSHWGLYHTLRAYWLTALTAPQVCFNIGVGGTSHFAAVNLSPVFLVGIVFDLSRLLYPECHGQKAGD